MSSSDCDEEDHLLELYSDKGKSRSYIRKKKYVDSLKLLNSAVFNTKDPIFFLERSYCLQLMKKYRLALKDGYRALEKIECGEAYLRIGKALYGLDRHPEAKEIIEKGLEVEPEHNELVHFQRVISLEPVELSEQQIIELKEVFYLFDEDLNGTIDGGEIKEVMQSLGCENITEQEIDKILMTFDSNEDESIDFAEFINILADELKSSSVEREIKAAFKIFDRDGDGTVNLDEMKRGMKLLGEEELVGNVEEMFKELKMEELKYEDFVRLLMINYRRE